jgi:hypothetical protein
MRSLIVNFLLLPVSIVASFLPGKLTAKVIYTDIATAADMQI